MDLFSPLRTGVKVTTGAARLATAAPRTIAALLGRHGEDTADPAGVPRREGVGTVSSEPSSAAGASGGIAGTVDAPGDAARVGAPDPTAARVSARQRTARQGERRTADIRATPMPKERTPVEPPEVVETEGSAAPHATIRVDAPWDGYDAMKAGDVVARLKGEDAVVKAVVRLYEQNGRKRKTIMDATAE